VAFLRSGPNNNGLRGRMGGQVYSKSGVDTIVREFVPPNNPGTKSQETVRGNLSRATKQWKTLTEAQRGQWGTYAEFLHSREVRRTRQVSLTGFQAYVALTSKFYQVNPAGTAPVAPPAVPFDGDSVTVTVAPGAGKVTLTANKANATGVQTEVLVQRLRASYRKPANNAYKHRAFVQFTSGAGLTQEVTLGPGAYALAIRFVKSSTGEATEMTKLNSEVVTFSVEQGGSGKAKKAA
jgi:hypothetical protein